jgi:hypothetical protein
MTSPASKLNTANSITFRFEVGQFLRHGTEIFTISEDRGPFKVLQHTISFERKVVREDDLIAEYLKGDLVACDETDVRRLMNGDLFSEDDEPTVSLPYITASDAAFRHGKMVRRSMDALYALGYTSLRPTSWLERDFQKVKDELRKQLPDSEFVDFKLSTIYSWSLRMRNSFDERGILLPNFSGRGGRNGSRIAPEALIALKKQFTQLRANPKARIRYREIYDNIQADLITSLPQIESLQKLPSASTVTRLVKAEFDAYEICRRNKGPKKADKIFRSFFPRDRTAFPLQIAEFDDKDSRVFLVDDNTGLPAGRGYLTLGVDQHSSAILGCSISERPRSTWSALCAYGSALLPKDRNHSDFALVQSDCDFYGRPGLAIFDNALYNHAKAMERALGEMHIDIAWSKPYRPTEKATVEGINGRLVSGIFDMMPGFGGEKGSNDGLNAGVESAIMTSSQFRQNVLKWSYDVFANTPREGGMTPRQRWHLGMLNRRSGLPSNIKKFYASIAIDHSVKFRPDGILFCGLAYQSHRLEALRAKMGHKARVLFRYRPDTMASIYAYDPYDNEHFIVEGVNPEYMGCLTLHQHRLIRKLARENGRRNPSISELLKYRGELIKSVSQLRTSTKLRERRTANLIGKIKSSEKHSSQGSTKIATELEVFVDTVDEIPLENDELDEEWMLPESF